uniref:Ubiquitin carboxyl-terminal hydrolase n=1 Tax=Lotharella oceanica TaxID=641309 RepID=A0A7S2TIM0_9EUKA|mmetsp:Transcript_1425/g.2700  ORF Transcript_1425/g.2700 Transcript_1425/m.2700 type:complete len:257 (+) Transcript_1425:3-773(+)
MHIPTPILAVMLLFPLTEASEKARVAEQEEIQESKAKAPEGVYHITQTVGNACGTIAVLHAVLNNMERLKPTEGKFFTKFLEETKGMTSKERAKALGESKDLEVEHEVVAKAGKTKANAREFANLHFIAFIKKNDVLYEMDGRKSMPIAHGKTSGATFLEDAFKQVKKFMAYAPKDRRFNVIVLAPKANTQPSAWGAGGGGGAGPSGGAPDAATQKERIASLAAMGIPAEAAKVALTQTNWSANRAVEFYFANMMG